MKLNWQAILRTLSRTIEAESIQPAPEHREVIAKCARELVRIFEEEFHG